MATKASKQIEEFLAKVSSSVQGQVRRADTNTALSFSVRDDLSIEDPNGRQASLLSQNQKSKKSLETGELSSIESTKGNADLIRPQPIVIADDSSFNDTTTVYSKQMRRRGHILSDQNLNSSSRLTKQSLVPPSNQYHKITAVNEFMCSKYDYYTREYGEFFQAELAKFEEKMDGLKREIQLNSLAEKRTSSHHTIGGQLGGNPDADNEKKTIERTK